MKYNLSSIMKRAWDIKKEADSETRNQKLNHNDFSPLKASEKVLFSLCLKMAWEEAKNRKATVSVGKTATIKAWFLNRKFGMEASHYDDTIVIEKETAKAVFGTVKCTYGFNNVMENQIWCPKSCLC